MEATHFRFIVSQKRGNISAVVWFIAIFTVVIIVMVDYLGKEELSEPAELIVISVVVFVQFLIFLPVLMDMSRGEATIALNRDFLTIKLDTPKMLLNFTELHVPFSKIKSYDLATEGNAGLVLRLKEGKKSFNLHAADKDQEKYVQEIDHIIKTIEQFNESADATQQIAFKSVYSSKGMKIVAAIYLLMILLFGVVLFTQSHAKLTYQALFFIGIGLPFLWQVVRRLRN